MAKVVDITEKLDFSGNPKIRVKEKEIEVNADAGTMLKIMGILSETDDPSPKDIMNMFDLLFNEQGKKDIQELRMNFSDFSKLVETAIGLVAGEADQGE